MAADILVYRATHVPVGDRPESSTSNSPAISRRNSISDFGDRIKALGLASGEYFPLAEPLIAGPCSARDVPMRDGSKKMSKSDASDNSRLNLTDDAETIAQKIRKAKTDPEPLPSEAEGLKGRPEAENLVTIFAALSARDAASILTEFGGGQFSTFKNALVELFRREAFADWR